MIEDTLGVRLQNVQFFICSIRSIIMYQICTVYTYVYVQCMYIYIYIYVCVCVCVCVCGTRPWDLPWHIYIYIYYVCVCVCACDICIQNMHQFYHRSKPTCPTIPATMARRPRRYTRQGARRKCHTLDVPWETSHGFPPGHDLEIGGFSMAMLVNDGWWF